jgi:hypothetical protein
MSENGRRRTCDCRLVIGFVTMSRLIRHASVALV